MIAERSLQPGSCSHSDSEPGAMRLVWDRPDGRHNGMLIEMSEGWHTQGARAQLLCQLLHALRDGIELGMKGWASPKKQQQMAHRCSHCFRRWTPCLQEFNARHGRKEAQFLATTVKRSTHPELLGLNLLGTTEYMKIFCF